MVTTLDSPTLLEQLAEILGSGGVAIMPCDTIYGVVGICPDAEERISAIKGRAPEQPYLSLIADESWLPRFSAQPLPDRFRPHWPGPLTLIFRQVNGGTRALRVPQDQLLRDLLAKLDRPVVSTSVNRHGHPALAKIDEIISCFGHEVDLVVDGGDRLGATPSTLVDLTKQPYRVLRQGAVQLSPELLDPQ